MIAGCNCTGESIVNEGIVVVGASAGGLAALCTLFAGLGPLPWPAVVVQHLGAGGDDYLAGRLARVSGQAAVVAESFMPLEAGRIHVAPWDYHLLVEDRQTLALSLEAPVNHCRPAVDPCFESAARVFGRTALAVVLTGANEDGARGARSVWQHGGKVVIEDPTTAEVPAMPAAALRLCPDAEVAPVTGLANLIKRRIGA